MTTECNRKNPLLRNGARQNQRGLDALDSHYFDVDERSLADLLVFSQRYSKQLRFHDGLGSDVNWLPFFDKDIIAILAGLSKVPVSLFRNFSNTLQAFLEDTSGLTDDELANHYKLYFHLPLMLISQIADFYARLPQGHELKNYIKQLLEQEFETELSELVSYYRGGLAELPAEFDDSALQKLDYNIDFNEADIRIQLPLRVTEQIDELHSLSALVINTDFIEGLSFADWPDFYNAVMADTTPYLDAAGDFHQQIYDALNYNLLSDSINKLYQAVEQVVIQAEQFLEASLQDASENHPAHYALWLSFLQLFQQNQSHINELTDRHLNYYYLDILQICVKPAEADRAHLLLSLSKNEQQHLLLKDTLFKGGKDSDGNPVVYSLDEDIVLNRGSIAELRSSYLYQVDQEIIPYGAKVTNSLDGQGLELSKEQPQWKPFGPVHDNSLARVGFAVSDPQLFLKEGVRKINLEVSLSQPLNGVFSSLAFKVLLSAEKGWYEIASYPALSVSLSGTTQLKFVINLDGDAPAIIPLDKDIHEADFDSPYPMATIEFDFVSGASAEYALFKDLYFEDISLSVDVSGLKDFTAANENGVIDVSKPFQPFGSEPIQNSLLIIGSNEILSKDIDTLGIDIDWEQSFDKNSQFLDEYASTYQVSLQYLKSGQWQGDENLYDIPILLTEYTTDELLALLDIWVLLFYFFFFGLSGEEIVDLFKLRNLTVDIPDAAKAELEQTLENPLYSNKSKNGFIKLALNKDFGHKTHLAEKTSALIDKARDDDETESTSNNNYDANGIPFDPYTPSIASMVLGYNTHASSPQQFYHLYPSGHKQETLSHGQLFPHLHHQGELYIGIANLQPAQRLNLLFQTVEGSANPLKNENQLQWHYLTGNDWHELEDRFVDDRTDNLSGSGIIGLAIPQDADLEHDILPNELHWLRMSVDGDADALNDLLAIDTQAVSVSFADQSNASDFLQKPLSPDTISKLQTSDAAIKKILQPSESFGGRPEESSEKFNLRVSERLRHKDRSSTIWDYEYLILEAFPEIYKVRCINHTQLCRDLENEIVADNEQKPGHVLVVPIPYVNATSGVDPRRPYTPKKTLVAIDKFLRQRISPFVKLEVQNPKIEEVQLKFNVAFNENIADIAFYKDLLNTATSQFLTPWTYDEGVEISFGGKWHKSALINFIEEQDYVHYLKDVEMFHKPDIEVEDSLWTRVNAEVIQATTSRSILVSHAFHEINEIIVSS